MALPKGLEIRGLVQGTDHWKSWRNTGIGGSDAPVIALGNVYGKTPYTLWAQKMGISQATFTEAQQAHIDRGNEREPAAREAFIEATGINVEPVCIQSQTHPWMLASLDGMNEDRSVGVEIKAPSDQMFRRIIDAGQTPEYYVDQIQHQLAVTGAREFYFWAWNPDVAPYAFIQRHVPDYARIEELVRKEAEFMRHVEFGIPPKDAGALNIQDPGVRFAGLTMFAGYGRVGKDTFGNMHQNIFGTTRYGFADPLKKMYCEMHGITLTELEEDKEKHRPGLIALGHGMRKVDGNVWVRGVFNSSTGIFDTMTGKGSVITDTRYVNEASIGRAQAERIGVPYRLIWVERPDVGPIHETEGRTTSLLRAMSDIIIVNDEDIESPIGYAASEMALVEAMRTVPATIQTIIHASQYTKLADHIINGTPLPAALTVTDVARAARSVTKAVSEAYNAPSPFTAAVIDGMKNKRQPKRKTNDTKRKKTSVKAGGKRTR